MNKISLSQPKIKELRSEYEKLMKELVEKNTNEQTDLLESFRDAASYDASVSLQQSRINMLRKILDKAKILPEFIKSEKIVLGSRFKARAAGNQIIHGRIVHPLEADPVKGLYSIESPYGMVLSGKRAGEWFKFNGVPFRIKVIY
ncbi:MAG: GreA/GreB family elongation factor [Patescibacteria group bacterium]|nr:GreA/GreB family elongation factor [Patescibacteria group bacterium]